MGIAASLPTVFSQGGAYECRETPCREGRRDGSSGPWERLGCDGARGQQGRDGDASPSPRCVY
nr:MAG TPA: hypothetical protein [Caudoviricetes sp.]DAW01078.1 MAG TPA: hypothetical protein [Caudoviricetes sp.]